MKKTYQRPEMQVLALQQRCSLLSGSDQDGMRGKISGYGRDSNGGFSQDDEDDEEE
jgi:hypothetical protein